LQFQEFVIATDHRSLSHLNEQRLHTHWQQKVFTKLLGLQYKIVYKKGVENKVADALSRVTAVLDVSDACYALSACQPKWISEIVDSYVGDSFAQDVMAKLMLDSSVVPHFTLSNGILRYKSKIWVGSDLSLQNKLLTACHSSVVGGHSGVPVTYRRIKQLFAWKGLKLAVHKFVTECVTCQQAKPDRTKSPGLLQPLSISEGAWQTITMDFVEGLPQSGQANCVLVVVDKFTRYAHFIPLKHPYAAGPVAKVFLDQVYKLHGMPSAIVSDRDRVFTSHLLQELFAMAKVQLNMSSSYHPQSDGQT
jgi:hypothetical protein